jgi:hypothetical protein
VNAYVTSQRHPDGLRDGVLSHRFCTMTTIMTTTMVIAMAMVLTVATPYAFASHSSSDAACENDGLDTGQNGEFSQGLYDMCGESYLDAFIRGCMSVEDNSREDCESATDAE